MPFNFLPPKILKDKYTTLIAKVKAKHEETMTEIGSLRQAQFKVAERIFTDAEKTFEGLSMAFRNLESLEINLSDRDISDKQQSKIITGAFLNFKPEIELEYSGILNKLLAMVVKNKPENSTFYSGIDEVIGITEENPMDEVSRQAALTAYREFITSQNLKVNLPEDVKNEEIVPLVTAQHNLRKIPAPIERVAKLQHQDSINTALLLPPKITVQAMNAKSKTMAADQLAEYTPKDEIGRYVRDVNAETINRVLITKNLSNVDSVPLKTVVLRKNNQVLTAYWVKNDELINKSLPESMVKDILSLLPRKNAAVFNSKLIKTIAKQYGCPISHSELNYLQMHTAVVPKIHVSKINKVPGIDGTSDVIDHDKTPLDNTELHQENAEILDRVIAKHKLKSPFEMVKEQRFADEKKTAKCWVDVNHTKEKATVRKFFFEKLTPQIEGYNIRQLKHVVPEKNPATDRPTGFKKN